MHASHKSYKADIVSLTTHMQNLPSYARSQLRLLRMYSYSAGWSKWKTRLLSIRLGGPGEHREVDSPGVSYTTRPRFTNITHSNASAAQAEGLLHCLLDLEGQMPERETHVQSMQRAGSHMRVCHIETDRETILHSP